MALLTLIRHGQSTFNLSNLFTGDIDAPLTALGEDEARSAGKKIMDISFNIAYTSMLVRAQESLRIILEIINESSIPIIKSAALNERRYGILQGLNKKETVDKYGVEQVNIWRRSYEIAPPGGESLKDTFNRVVPYYKLEIEAKLRTGKNVLIVAHGNSLRALVMYLENFNSIQIAKVDIATGIPRIYTYNNNLKLIKPVMYLN